MALPPKRLTKQQFLRNRPGGKYQNYLNAYTRQHGGPPSPAGGRSGNPNQPFAGPTYESLLRGINIETPAQLEARANRMAQQGITAQQKVIRDEAKLLRDEAMRRMQAQAAAGRLAAAQNAGLFGMVGGEYNAAAQEIQNLGSNLGASMQGMTAGDVARNNAGLAAIGAPALSEVGLGGLGGEQQQAVENYRNATIPAQAFGTAGHSAQFGLAGMVTAQNLRATQEAQAGLQEAIKDANDKRGLAMRALVAGRPGEAAKFLAMLQESNNNAREIAMGLITARQTFGLQNQENERATNAATQDRATSILNRQLARRNQKLAEDAAARTGREIDEARSFARGIYVDKMGRAILGANGQPIPWKKPPVTPSSTTAGETPWEQNRYDVERSAKEFVYNSTKNGESVTRQSLLRYLKTIYPKAIWPKITSAVAALPNTYFKGRVNTDDSTSIWKKGSGKGTGTRAN